MPTFTIAEPVPVVPSRLGRRRYGRSGVGRSHHPQVADLRNNGGSNDKDPDPSDGNGSLTYSASSSVQSHSSTGESTDSSFAEILHVLDLDDDTDLMNLMTRADESESFAQHQHPFHIQRNSDFPFRSNNSLDVGPRHPVDDDFRPISFTGQPSGSHKPDGGGQGNIESPTFSSADSRKAPIRKPFITAKKDMKSEINFQRSRNSANIKRPSSIEVRSPVPKPRSVRNNDDQSNNRQLWYSQWWMCGFTDALNINEW